eukprot:3867989-Ditylum_brightwellii.AAC.1
MLHPGQFGGRQGKDAQMLTLIEELKDDISYSSRKDIINFDNDVASCYDWIIPSLASLVAWKKGLHKNVMAKEYQLTDNLALYQFNTL